jgi:hypothetical protein
MQTRHWLNVAVFLGGIVALSGCGGGDAEFCSKLDQVKTALQSNDASLRGERSGPAESPAPAFVATTALPGAGKCEIIDGDSGLVVYTCEYPGTAAEALRDRVDTCGGEKLAWDESGKQWYRGAGDNLTLSVTANEPVGSEAAVTAIIYTRF